MKGRSLRWFKEYGKKSTMAPRERAILTVFQLVQDKFTHYSITPIGAKPLGSTPVFYEPTGFH